MRWLQIPKTTPRKPRRRNPHPTPASSRRNRRLFFEPLEGRHLLTGTISIVPLNDAIEGGPSGLFRLTGTGFTDPMTMIMLSLEVSGTATEMGEMDPDYQSSEVGMSFLFTQSGENSYDIEIEALVDHQPEDPETVILTIPGGSGYTIGSNDAEILIYDAPPPSANHVVNVIATDPSAAELNSDNGVFTITLDPAPTMGSVTVTFELGGTATNGSDYATINPLSVTFNECETTKTVTIDPIDDSIEEPGGENVVLKLTVPHQTPYNVGPNREATVHIADNDFVGISIGDASATEGQTLSFPVTLAHPVDHVVKVSYATSDGSAVQPGDYTSTSGLLVINPGSWGGTIQVPTMNDALSESTETMTVTLSNPQGAQFGDASGTGSILDRATNFEFWIDDVTIREGEQPKGSSQKAAVFTVKMWPSSGSSVTIDYATADDTAVAPDDYTSTSGTLTFTTGQTEKTISVPIIDDKIFELTEQFFVNLSNASTGTIQDSQGVGTILDNDILSLFKPSSCTCDCTCAPVKTGTSAPAGTFQASVPSAGLKAAAPDTKNYPVSADMAFDPSDGTPQSIAVTPIVDGTPGTTIYFDPTGIVLGENYRFTAAADVSGLDTGRQVIQLEIEADYGSESSFVRWDYHQDVLNRDGGEFGDGWLITWVDRLHVQGNGVSWDKGDGNLYYFSATSATTFQRPYGELDFATITFNTTSLEYTLVKKTGEKLFFDEDGVLTSRQDRNGNETSYAYVDADSDSVADEISVITDFAGGETSFTYTAGLVTAIEDFAGRTTALGYDGSGRLTSVTEPDPDAGGSQTSPVTTFAYDGTSNRIASITDPTNATTEIEYVHGLLSKIIHPDGGEETFLAQIARGMAGVEAGSGPGTFLNPAILFRTVELKAIYKNEVNNTWQIEADQFGNPTRITDPEGNVTLYVRNADGLVTQQTLPDPDGPGGQPAPVASFTYDAKGNVTQVTNPNGTQHNFTYDATFSQLLTDAGPQWYSYPTTNTVNSTNGNVTQSDFLGRDGVPGDITSFTYTAAPTLSTDPPAGLVASVTDPLGRVTLYEYDARGNVTKVTFADGTADEAFVELAYDSADRLVEFTDELGRLTTYAYDNLDRLITLTLPDPDGTGSLTSPVYAYAYTKNNQLQKITDPLSRETTYAYTSRGDLETVTRPDHDGNSVLTVDTYDYDLARRLEDHTDPLGRVTAFAHDTLNRQTQVTLADPDGGGSLTSPVYQTAYDWLNRVTQLTDPLGHITKLDYLKHGKQVRTRYNLPNSSGVDPDLYDRIDHLDYYGRVAATTSLDSGWGPLGGDSSAALWFAPPGPYGSRAIWQWYDVPTKLSGYDVRRSRVVYNSAGNLVETANTDEVETQYVYDNRDRLVEIKEYLTATGSVYATTSFAYDDAGQLISMTDALGRVTSYEYDNLGRLVKRTDPDPDGGGSLAAPITTFAYDAASRLVKVTDPLNHDIEYAYDLLDNRITVIAEDTGETTMTFDAVGNLLTLTDPEGNTTSWTYDALNRVIEEKNELNDSRFFVYDAASRLTKKTDRNERVTEYVYDNRNRLTAELWKDGSTTVRTLSFDYNRAGALIAASDPAASFTFTVDALGQVRQESHSLDGLTAGIFLDRVLDYEGRQTALETEIGGTNDLKNTYTYDGLRRITSIKQEGYGGNTVAEKRADFTYNVLGQFTEIERFADVSGSTTVATTNFTYDGLNRLLSLVHKDPSVTTLAGYDYAYDAASRITEIDSFVDGLTTFSYDVTNQLTAADHTGQTDETYSFDLNGNRDMTGYTVGANNQLTSDGTYNYTYDDEGNRLTKTKISDSSKEEYTWDYRNRLTKVTFKNGSGTVVKTVDHAYDVFDRWIRRTIDPDGDTGSAAAVDAFFAQDGLNILFEFDGPNASDLTDRNLWGPAVDQIMASEDVTSLLSAGNTLWPLTDHLGTPRDIADRNESTGAVTVVNHRRYDAFGVLVSESNGNITIRFGFTARPFDEHTGFNNHWKRWLAMASGVWMSEDPSGLGGQDVNFVRYVGNSPTEATDPSGLVKVKWFQGLKVLVDRDTAEFVLQNGKRIKIRNAKFIDSCVGLDDIEKLTNVSKDTIARLREKYGDISITFDKFGQPDFSRFRKAKVIIPDPGVSNYGDLAWAKLVEDDPELYKKVWYYRKNYNWHHAPDGSLQLIDKDLHTAYQHTGLNSILSQLASAGIMLLPGAEALNEGRGKDVCRDAVWSITPGSWISDTIAGYWSWLYEWEKAEQDAFAERVYEKYGRP